MSGDRGVTEPDRCPVTLTTRYGRIAVPDIENDLIGRFLSRYGEWAWLEALFAASVVPDGARVLDVGAFVGTFGLGVAQLRSLDFLCFVEPNPVVAPLLRANVTDTTPCPAEVIEAMVAGAGVRAGISNSQPDNLGATSFIVSVGPQEANAIRALSLADLRAAHGTFDLIKLDVEGMELEALRGDADFLATGRTTLWVEANEDPGVLEVARTLLLWNLELFYFAFPAFNPNNFNRGSEPIFPFAFEAGLLAAPRIPPTLSPELRDAGCILRSVQSIDDVKAALWRTPRWGMAEWTDAISTQEMAALAGRTIQGEAFADFLAPRPDVTSGTRITIWQRLGAAQVELHDMRAQLSQLAEQSRSAHALAAARLIQLEAEQVRRERVEEALRTSTALAEEHLSQLKTEQLLREQAAKAMSTVASLAAERLTQLETEELRRKEVEKTLCATAALAAERLSRLQAEQLLREKAESTLAGMTALAAERLDQLQTAISVLDRIQSSTMWRVSAPLRQFVDRRPALHVVLLKTKASLAPVVKRWRGRKRAGLPHAPARTEQARLAETFMSEHREVVRPHFDADYYLAMNQDVMNAGVDPLDHFLRQGWHEGRAPSPAFNVAYYLETNKDVSDAGLNPLLHYIWAGKAEGRLPRRPLDLERQHLAAAVSPRLRSACWTGAIDWSTLLSPGALATRLPEAHAQSRMVVSISHDDYAVSTGGVQNAISDEQRAFEAAGWQYLHISPAVPLPMLADPGPAVDYLLRLRLNGAAIGVARFTDLALTLTALRGKRNILAFVFHHLSGHIPELLAALPAENNCRPIVWVHDFFSLCPSYALMRNDVKFCGAPPTESPSCSVCVFGTERRNHLRRMRAFFEKTCPTVLAPSAVAMRLWRQRGGHPHAERAVVPLARLSRGTDSDPIVTPDGAPLRVAHLGGVPMHKGWPVFERLASAHVKDARYEFYHLGSGGAPSSQLVFDPVLVTLTRRNAMIEAVVHHRIDVVVCWSLVAETFGFTVHEALAGGAFVVARESAGNIWPTVQANASDQGCAVADEAALVQLFASGEIRVLVSRARRLRGILHPGGNTAEFLLGHHTTIGSPAETREVCQ